MSVTRHYGHVTGEGRLHAPSFALEAKSWPIGTPLELTVRNAQGRKTRPQENLLHVILRIAAKEIQAATGTTCTMELLKAAVKAKGLYPMVDFINPSTGEVIQVAKSGSEMDKEEISATIDRVMEYLTGRCGLKIPSPGEQEVMDFR